MTTSESSLSSIIDKKSKTMFSQISNSQNIENRSGKSFLLNLYSIILIHSNSSTNPNNFSKTRNRFRNNMYLLYNSVFFSSFSRSLSKSKLSEFFSSKFDKNSRDIVSMFNSKKKIGFGKLTWYWVFRLMFTNRFLFNFKECRSSLVVAKFSFYELALKSYERDYNNWLHFSNKSTEDINRMFVKKKNRIVYKTYYNSDFRSVLDNNNLRHQPLTSDLKQDQLDFETFKVIRRMPAYSQPSVNRFHNFKKKHRIYFSKNLLFSKVWRSRNIRLFKNIGDSVDSTAEVALKKWNPFIFKKNIRIHRNLKYWEKKMRKSLWGLRSARSDYFSAASFTFCRVNYLSDKFLHKTKPTILRSFTNNCENSRKNFINFKYRFPINSAEMSLGYDYYNTFPTNFNNSKSYDIGFFNDLGRVRSFDYRKNLIKSVSCKKSINTSNFFNFKVFKKSENITDSLKKITKNLNKTYSDNFNNFSEGVSQRNFSGFGLFSKGVGFSNKFSIKKANAHNIKSSYKSNSNGRVFFKKFKNLINNRVFFLFCYKSNVLASKFMFKLSTKYFNFRYYLNKLRLDHLLANIFLNSILSYNSIVIANNLIRNRVGSIKQTLLLKLFSKISYLDNKNTSNFCKRAKNIKLSSIANINRRILASRFFKKDKRGVVLKLKKLFNNNDVFYKNDNSVVVVGKKIKQPVNYASVFKKRLKIKKKFKFIDSYRADSEVSEDSSKVGEGSKFVKSTFFKKKTTFKKHSLVRALYFDRYAKNILQLGLDLNKKRVLFEDGLGLEELPWNKTLDSLGEVVFKFNRKRLFSYIRSYGSVYSGSFSYNNFFSKKLLKDSSIYSSTDASFNKNKLFLLRWKSCKVSSKRFNLDKSKNLFFSTNLKVASLYAPSNRSSKPKISKTSLLASANFKKMFSDESFSVNRAFFRLKAVNFEKRRDSFLKRRKLLFRLKPRMAARRRRLYITMPNVRFFRRPKSLEWWLYVNKKTFFNDRKNAVVRKIIHKKMKRRLRSFFIFKKNNLIFLKYYFNFNSLKSLDFFKTKKFEYSLRTLTHANLLRSKKISDRSSIKHRSYWSKKKKSHKLKNDLRFAILSKNWRKRKTRYGIFVHKSANSLKSLDTLAEEESAFLFKKYRKEMYSLSWLRAGLSSESLTGDNLDDSFVNVYKLYSKKKKYFNNTACKFYFLNKNSSYRISKHWNFNSMSIPGSSVSDNSIKTKQIFYKPLSTYFRRFFRFSKNIKTFNLRTGSRLLFRRGGLHKKSTISFFSKLGIFSKNNKLLISKSFYKAKKHSVSRAVEKKNIQFCNMSDGRFNPQNLLGFFKKVGIVFNTFFANVASTRKKTSHKLKNVGLSSKFLVGNNIVNYFNLSSLGDVLLKNISIYNNLDLSVIFSGAELSWKDIAVRSFEKNYSSKRRLNRKYFSLFFFFHQRETYLYRKYLLNYKKQLRDFDITSSGLIVKKKIKYGNGLWRSQIMSSNVGTSYLVDSAKIKYNFTKHSAENRKASEFFKKDTKHTRDSLRKNLKFALRKKFKWLNLNKKHFKDSPSASERWSWKNNYADAKGPVIALREDLWAKAMRNFKFVTMDKYSNFIGKRLVKRIRRRIFKRKRLFWTQKRFLIDDASWNNFGYFWSKLSEDYNKYNLEFRKKTFKFPWKRIKPKNYFKKTRAFLWRVKNPLNWRKHGQYAKRFYPRFWYKVFRRKFPLKRHRKDWALKLGKMFAMWQHKKKKYTFFDSSAVYFKNLSINVKPKRNRSYQSYLRKFDMQYVDRDLEIFDFELDPKFDRKAAHFKGPFHTNVKYFADFKKFKKNVPLTASWLFSANTFSKRMNRVPTTWLDSAENNLFNVYTKRRSRLLSDRFDAYSQFLCILKKKISNYVKFKKPGYFFKSFLETRSIFDANNDNNIGYLPNPRKYSLVGRNFMYTMSLKRSSLISAFADESLSAFNLLNYKFGFISPNNVIWQYVRKSSNQNYWDNLVYANTSKYRYPDFSTKHSMSKLSYGGNMLALISLNTSILNKNFVSPKNLPRVNFKRVDFLERVGKGGVFKFKTKVSGFFKKNLWVFSTLQFSKNSIPSLSI